MIIASFFFFLPSVDGEKLQYMPLLNYVKWTYIYAGQPYVKVC